MLCFQAIRHAAYFISHYGFAAASPAAKVESKGEVDILGLGAPAGGEADEFAALAGRPSAKPSAAAAGAPKVCWLTPVLNGGDCADVL